MSQCLGRLVGPPRGARCWVVTMDPSGYCKKHRDQRKEPEMTGEKITEEWVVTWFPPEAEQRQVAKRSEVQAREFAKREGVAEWNPLLTHRTTVTSVVETILELEGQPLPFDREERR